MLSIIIPAKDHLELTRDAISSIFETTPDVEIEIILINNGSNRSFSDYFSSFSKKDRRLILIDCSKAESFSQLCNFGANNAKGDCFLFLNNDISVKKGWLESLVELVENENVGIVGSRLLSDDNSIQHDGVTLPLWLYPYNSNRMEPNDNEQSDKIMEVFAVTGACLMIKKKKYFKLGGFDPYYSWRLEDVDLCLKAKQEGLKVLCSKENKIFHYESQTPLPSYFQKRITESYNYFVQKWSRYFNPRIVKKIQEYRGNSIEQVIIFGTGYAGKLLSEMLTGNDFNITGYLDTNEKNWGTNFLGHEILSPDRLESIKYDKIFIASQHIYEIRKFLDDHNILEDAEVPIIES